MKCPWIGTIDSELIAFEFADEHTGTVVMGLPTVITVSLWWQQAAWFILTNFHLQDPNATTICSCVFCTERLEGADSFSRYLVQMRHAIAGEIDAFCRDNAPPDLRDFCDADVDVEGFVNGASRRVSEFVLDRAEVDEEANWLVRPNKQGQRAEQAAESRLWGLGDCETQ